MVTKIQKWGNSQGLRFPKTVLADAHIAVGDEVNISVTLGKIIIEPVHKIRGKYRIQDLVAKMPADYQVQEVDWGDPVGKEIW